MIFKLIKRLVNVFLGKANRAVEDMEKKDPDAIYKIAIEESEKNIAEMRQLAREANGLVFEKSGHTKHLEEMLKEREADLQLAVQENNSEVGARIIENIEELKDKLAEAISEKMRLEGEADEATTTLEKLIEERKVLLEESKTAKQMAKSQELADRIQDRKNGLGNDAISQALESARTKINSVKAARASDERIKEKSLDGSVEDLRKERKSKDYKSAFEKMVSEKQGHVAGE